MQRDRLTNRLAHLTLGELRKFKSWILVRRRGPEVVFMVLRLGPSGGDLAAAPGLERWLGYDDLAQFGDLRALMHLDDIERASRAGVALMRGQGGPFEVRYRMVCGGYMRVRWDEVTRRGDFILATGVVLL